MRKRRYLERRWRLAASCWYFWYPYECLSKVTAAEKIVPLCRTGWGSVLRFGTLSEGLVVTLLVQPQSSGHGKMELTHWLWPKGEVRMYFMIFCSKLLDGIQLNLLGQYYTILLIIINRYEMIVCDHCSCVNAWTVRANFEFINKLGVDRWCFHDRDIAPDGKTLEVSWFLLFTFFPCSTKWHFWG